MKQAGFDTTFSTTIKAWKDKRNTLMHELGEEQSLRVGFDSQVKIIATDGIALAKEVSAFVMRLKKRLSKTP